MQKQPIPVGGGSKKFEGGGRLNILRLGRGGGGLTIWRGVSFAGRGGGAVPHYMSFQFSILKFYIKI